MKNKIAILLTTSITLVGFAFGQSSSQDDPFRIERKPLETNEGNEPNIMTHTEHVIVSTEYLNQWELRHEDKSITYDIALKWVDLGKAKIEHSSSIIHKSGQKSSIISALELAYPTEYTEQGPGMWPVPQGFETRYIGLVSEVESVIGDDQVLHVRSENYFTKLIGSKSHQAFVEKTRQPKDMFQPNIYSERASSDHKSIDNETVLILRSGQINSKKTTRLIFQKTELVPLSSVKTMKEVKTTNVELKVFGVNLERPQWDLWKKAKRSEQLSLESWPWIQQEIKQKRAQMSFTSSAVIPSGKKATIEKIKEVIYPVVFKQMVKDGESIPASTIGSALVPTEFETRNVGTIFDADVVRHKQGEVIDVRLALEDSKTCGSYTYHRVKDGDEWKSDAELPIFASVSLNTDVSLIPSEVTLVGVTSALKDDGTLDSNKVALYFLQAE